MNIFLDSDLSNPVKQASGKTTSVQRFLSNLKHSGIGIEKPKSILNPDGSLDSFEISKTISTLLSPACGMTDEEKANYLASITRKLKSGKKLTPEEMRFLQAENPQMYAQVARVQKMRDTLEARLKSCRSKQEVAQAHASAMSGIADDDPMKEFLVAAYNDVVKDFHESDEYKDLPATNEEENRSDNK